LRTKADLALELLDRARQWGLWFRAVVADSWYGSNTAFVKGLDERSLPYVLEVNGDRRVNVRARSRPTNTGSKRP
jgi:SRSO17 transposase